MGKKKQPTYRVVAADSRSPRNGRFIEIIGFYEPRQEPSVVRIDNDRALHWLRHGAQPTERVEKLLKISGAWDNFRGTKEAQPKEAQTASTHQVEPSLIEASSGEAQEASGETAQAEPASQAS